MYLAVPPHPDRRSDALRGSRTFLIYTAGWFLVVHLVVIVYEEPVLHQKFGGDYERYTAAVGRWFPKGRSFDVKRP
jgi:protein-S-isoprenylcysteine O-methyltransferase Ste14